MPLPHSFSARRRPGVLALLALLSLALAGCSQKAAPEEPVRAVKLVTVAASTEGSGQVFAGEVRARIESQLGFRVGGKILKRQAEVGQRVQAGQLLAQLDPQDLRLAADAARAQVAAARTSYELAAADFKRYSALKAQNFISGAELERREATLRSAKASLDQAQAQLAAQSNQAGYANLVADAPGVVTAIDAEPGQVVSAGMPVVRLARDGQRDAVFAVPEDQVARFAAGQPVQVRTWASAAPLAGRVREVGASADRATRTFTVKVALEDAAPPLGTTVSVLPKAAAGAAPAVLKLPTSALRQEGGGTAVWVLDEKSMTLRSQPIVVGGVDGNQVIVSQGLAPGMRVVAAGVHVLTAGQKVSIYEGKYPEAQVPPGRDAIDLIANVAPPPSLPSTPAAK
ncbi:efflux RND transporter periplasmic adaptor subunit [Xylophilus sp. ASV27]|uniref:efflux RND transporter periplasmic adaptor subunit n=1 Tax=Xylophilus sp. ASV27 TaxID=2795129 RepID=UPI0018ECFA51|nr:efflux RND transporter periplasmic adaptor subunit [Xylophilus sp. ASV27]